jgi:hypothetical protein
MKHGYQLTAPAFFASLRPDQVSVVLDSMVELRKINAQTERVIAPLAEADYDAIWQFFGRRIARKAIKSTTNEGYDPIPHQFFQAQTALGKSPDRAVDIVRAWYKPGDRIFQPRRPTGGACLPHLFPRAL